MIFSAEHLHLIRAGRKTQTRRLVRVGKDCQYRPGRPYAVQRGRGQSGEFKVLVVDVRAELLGEISDDDARREGYQHATAFERAWRTIHGRWEPNVAVWVISFEMARDEVRLLARRGGYTDKRHLALTDEPEAVDQVTQSAIDAGELRVARSSTSSQRLDDPNWLAGEDEVKEYLASGTHLEVLRGAAPARPAPARPRKSLLEMAEETLQARILRHEGLSPDEVHAVDPLQGTPGDVRARRKAMGLRAVDGMPPRSQVELDEMLVQLLERGSSVRQLAFAMDWSHGKAQRAIAEHRARLAA